MTSQPPSSGREPTGRTSHPPAPRNSKPPTSIPPPANGQTHASPEGHGRHHHGSPWVMALGALGVVYGDIGTSPLYALRECLVHIQHGGQAITPATMHGLLALFFWSMLLVVSFKYLFFIMRADNHGEGGILALLALVMPRRGVRSSTLVLLGLFGSALLYADGMLTPAISVLSAVEGLREIEALRGLDTNAIIGISVLILTALFVAQSYGTEKIGAAFGPVMLLWFASIGIMGLYWILQHIGQHPMFLLHAINPWSAVQFFVQHRVQGFLVLGSVVLCITGGEALYADMGHFGRRPIAKAWVGLVWPALVLNYFGQGAMVLEHPETIEAPFFSMVSGSVLRVSLVALATMATVIASQALISGAFSLTRQAIQLGYLPRLEIRHTSSETEGQIYVPEINWLLMVACIALVIIFKTSGEMAAAYGIAVTGTMAITTVLFYGIAKKWWGRVRAGILTLVLLLIDLAFLSANVPKIKHGGWIPLAVAAVLLGVMTTWKMGRERVSRFLKNRSRPLDEFLLEIDEKHPHRVAGTSVFMTSWPNGTPPVLLHHYKHNKVLHEQVVLLSIMSEDVPQIRSSERVQVERLREGFFRVTAHYGFMETPRVIQIMRLCESSGLHTHKDSTSFYLGREKLVVTSNAGMSFWRKLLFSFLSRNARPASDFFELPPHRVVEVGMQLEL